MTELERLIRYFEEAQNELGTRVLELSARGADVSAAERLERRKEATQILAALRKRTLTDEGAPAGELVRDAYLEGARAADADLEGKPLARNFGGAHREAAEVLYANLRNSLEGGIAHAGRQVDDAYRRATLEELFRGQAASRTRRESSARIADNLAAQGIQGFRDSAGRNWTLKNYAEMAARTTQREAVSHGTINRLVEGGTDLVKVEVSPGACAICQKHSGVVYSITGKNAARYPVLTQIPPYHPRCTCVLAAFIERFNAQAVRPAQAEAAAPVGGPRPAGAADNIIASRPAPDVEDDPFNEDWGEPDDELTGEELQERKLQEKLLRDMEAEETSRFYEIIKEDGGIRPSTSGLDEEYRFIPPIFRRNDGMRGDEMADKFATTYPEFGITDEASMLQFFLDRYGAGAR